MSRYISVDLQLGSLREIATALDLLEVAYARSETAGDLVLEESLDCPAEPVDLRLEGAVADALEPFGFTLSQQGPQLICSDVDRRRIERRFLPKLQQAVARVRLQTTAAEAGLDLDEQVETDGTRRLRLRKR